MDKMDVAHHCDAGTMVSVVAAVVVMLNIAVDVTEGHGRLWEPPSRSSMWRRGYNTTINTNDNELNCGGFTNQWVTYNGLCGICGDPYQQQPRDNEIGGKYASGIITRTYPIGGKIDAIIGLTANHLGYFEFKICPLQDSAMTESQACLESHRLQINDGDFNGFKYHIRDPKIEGDIALRLILPSKFVCRHCLLQWRYVTGARWGCDHLACGKGKGPQEEFYGCSDISIADVSTTIYNNPLPESDPSKGTVGLNDLGSTKTHDVTMSVVHRVPSFKKPDKERHTNVEHKQIDPNKSIVDQINLGSGNALQGIDKEKHTIVEPKQVDPDNSIVDQIGLGSRNALRSIQTTMSPNNSQSKLEASQMIEPTVVNETKTPKPITDQHSRNEATLQQFLEKLTLSALMSYYGTKDHHRQGNCIPTTKYKLNPIVHEFCRKVCSYHISMCPYLVCTCVQDPVASSDITSSKLSKGIKHVAQSHNLDKQHLKKFVKTLISKNKLIENKATLKLKAHAVVKEYVERPRTSHVAIPRLGRMEVIVSHPSRISLIPSLDEKTKSKIDENQKSPKHKHGVSAVNAEITESISATKSIPENSPTVDSDKLEHSQSHQTIRPKKMLCTASVAFSHNPFMANWCNTNCALGFCPSRVCSCNY